MISKGKIKEFLKNESFEEIDELEYRDGIVVYNFIYRFDDPELEAAKEYANENNGEENGEDEWYDEYFLPYLSDIAADNLRDAFEDICEEFEITGDFAAYDIGRDSFEECEVVMVFAGEDVEFDMDEIIDELDL